MAEHDRKETSESQSEAEREETIRDLDVSEEESEDVKGGAWPSKIQGDQ